MKLADFKIEQTKVTQEQLEAWQDTMVELREGKTLDDLSQAAYDRFLVVAALREGWFSSLPEGFDEDKAKAMKPGNLKAVSNLVKDAYVEITTPDESFT